MFKERLQKFSIRKLTVGAASVLIGTATALFVNSNDSVAKADTNSTDTQQTESTGDTTDITKKTNLNIVSGSEVSKTTEGADTSKGAGEEKAADQSVKPRTPKTAVKLAATDASNDGGAPNKDNETPTKSDDDKVNWPKADVNDWNWNIEKNTDSQEILTIQGYKGQETDILTIPNTDDFINAGKLDQDGKAEISSTTMADLAKNSSQISISKTGNGKLYAEGGSWSNTFANNTTVTNLDLSCLDTSNVTNMSGMFVGDNNLQTVGDISNWNTDNVTNMSSMFDGDVAYKGTLDLSGWNTEKVTDFCEIFNDLGASTLNISGWDFTKANPDNNPENPNVNIDYGTWLNPDANFLSPNNYAKELIACDINGIFTGIENRNVITVTDYNSKIPASDEPLNSSIYLVNKGNNEDNQYLTVKIEIPSVIKTTSSVQDAQDAKNAILAYIERQIRDYIDGKIPLDPFDSSDNLKIDSIFDSRYSRTDPNVSDTDPVDLDYDSSAAISNYLKQFFNVSNSTELKLRDTADNDDPEYSNLPLIAAAHGEFEKVNNTDSGAGEDNTPNNGNNDNQNQGNPNTTPDTPNTTPDTPNTDNNGDQGKEPNNSNKDDNDKQDHGNKGNGSATSTTTNTGRNTGSVTKLDNSGAGSNKSVNGNDNELPQTGEKETSMASVLGLAAISLGALMGLAVDRKKKRN